MSIVRDPFRDLSKLQERMNQMFDQTFLRSDGREEEIQEGSWSPAVDIQETPDQIVLRADLPGISIEQIELKIENDRLTLKGERIFDPAARREDFHRIERPIGKFCRSFTLPRTLNQTAIQAELKNGVLEVILPKKAETQSRQIRVDVR